MKHLKALSLMVAAIALAATALPAEEGVDLRLKLKAGQVLRYETIMEQNMDMDMAGTKMVMKNTTAGTSSFKVVSVDEKGNCKMELTTEKMKSSIQSPTMNMEYDSSRPEDKEKEKTLLGKFIALIAAARFTAVVDPTGKVLEPAGMEDIEKKLTEAFPEAVGQIKMMTGKEVSEGMWTAFCQRPEEKKKPGDSWSIEKDAMGMMRMKMTSKLDKVENGQVFVVPAGLEVAFGNFGKPGEPANPMAAMAKNFKVTKSEMSGTTRMDATTGAVQESDQKLVMDYGMQVPGSKEEVSFRMVQTTKSKLLPVGDSKPEEKK